MFYLAWLGQEHWTLVWRLYSLSTKQDPNSYHVLSSNILVPGRHFAHIYIDLVGPLPLVSVQPYLLTLIDCTTCWPEATPVTLISAKCCAWAFIYTWISRFGIPALLTSDCGAQFTSSFWARNLKDFSFYHHQLPSSG